MGKKKEDGPVLELKTGQHGVIAKATEDKSCFPAILDNTFKIVVRIDIKRVFGNNFLDNQFRLFGECKEYRCLAN